MKRLTLGISEADVAVTEPSQPCSRWASAPANACGSLWFAIFSGQVEVCLMVVYNLQGLNLNSVADVILEERNCAETACFSVGWTLIVILSFASLALFSRYPCQTEM